MLVNVWSSCHARRENHERVTTVSQSKVTMKLGVVVHARNPSTWEADGSIKSSRSA
jgi:hypothetical protein